MTQQYSNDIDKINKLMEQYIKSGKGIPRCINCEAPADILCSYFPKNQEQFDYPGKKGSLVAFFGLCLNCKKKLDEKDPELMKKINNNLQYDFQKNKNVIPAKDMEMWLQTKTIQ